MLRHLLCGIENEKHDDERLNWLAGSFEFFGPCAVCEQWMLYCKMREQFGWYHFWRHMLHMECGRAPKRASSHAFNISGST